MSRVPTALAAVLALAAAAAAAPEVVSDGDRIEAVLAPDAGPRELALPAAAGAALRVKIRGEAALVLLDPDGSPLALSAPDRRAGRATLEHAALPVTGVYGLLLTGDGAVRLKVRSRAPRKIRLEGAVEAGGSALLEFDALAGSRIDVKLRGADGLRPDMPVAEVPGDGTVPLRPSLAGPRVKVVDIRVPDTGEGTILVTPRTDEGGTFRATIRVHEPRDRRTVTLPETAGDEHRAGGDLLVLGPDGGRLDDETLDLRIRIARAHLLHGRGPGGEARDRVDLVVELETTAGSRVGWVLLRFRDPADFAPGELALDDARIEVLHVVTDFRGLLYSSAVPGIDGPRVGRLTLVRARAEAGAAVEGVLDGYVVRDADGRRIVLDRLPIDAEVVELTTRAIL